MHIPIRNSRKHSIHKIEQLISSREAEVKQIDLKQLREIVKETEQKKSSMDALRQEREAIHQKRRAERKDKLQKELKELDEKSTRTSDKK